MLTLVVLTAALLAVILVAALVTVLVLAMQTQTFMAETSAALEGIAEGSDRLAGHLERVRRAIEAAASELATAER